jgi:maltooligosyltrehalose trehalohydrolase
MIVDPFRGENSEAGKVDLNPVLKAQLKLGANYVGDGRCHFLVWAPSTRRVELHILSPEDRILPMQPIGQNYYEVAISDPPAGTLYRYRLEDQNEYPDPASQCQPQGVHGPSQVVNHAFNWDDSCWYGLPLPEYIIYELHVGTFTPEGTFAAIIPHLDRLKDLGITAIEMMPVAQFPGNRNWGYDGAYPFAVQNSYGGVAGLKHLVNACHKKGLAAILDVVYNHLGPEGNNMAKFGPYFTDRYKTSWGAALNFDGRGSDDVRRFFIENALYWIGEFHFDALRLDAAHAILDFSPVPFVEELAIAVKEQAENLQRRIYLIAESEANDARLVRPRDLGGYGLDAIWSDDFHHALHVLLTGEQVGYYRDFDQLSYLAKAVRDGFAYSGQYSPYRGRRRGSSPRGIPPRRFVVFSQNHDQVGNRMLGDRLSRLVSFAALKLAASLVLLSPAVPLLFMGEEYGETAPFPYFVSHSDPLLVEAVRQGRKSEFSAFYAVGEPPDPQSEETFRSAKLDHNLRDAAPHRDLFNYYRELIQLRKEVVVFRSEEDVSIEALAYEKQKFLFLQQRNSHGEMAAGFNFNSSPVSLELPVSAQGWRKKLDSEDVRWQGKGSQVPNEFDSDGGLSLTLNPQSVVLFTRDKPLK